MLQERLEGLLAPFTVHLADRIERARVTNAELQEQMSIAKAKRDAEEAEAKKFEQLVRLFLYFSILLGDLYDLVRIYKVYMVSSMYTLLYLSIGCVFFNLQLNISSSFFRSWRS